MDTKNDDLKRFVQETVYSNICKEHDLIKKPKLTLREVSERIGRQRNYIANIRSSAAIPTLEYIFRIAAVMNIDYSLLLKDMELYYLVFDSISPLYIKEVKPLRSVFLKYHQTDHGFFLKRLTEFYSNNKVSLYNRLFHMTNKAGVDQNDTQKELDAELYAAVNINSADEEWDLADKFNALTKRYFSNAYSIFLKSSWYIGFYEGEMCALKVPKSLVAEQAYINLNNSDKRNTVFVDRKQNEFIKPGYYFLEDGTVKYFRNDDEATFAAPIVGRVRYAVVIFD